MRTTFLTGLFLVAFTSCRESALVCVRNTPDWFVPENCTMGHGEPVIEVAFLTERGKPLPRRRVYFVEVDVEDKTKALAIPSSLLNYSNALYDARMAPFLITDEQGRIRLRYDDHRIQAFPETGTWHKGTHAFRFSTDPLVAGAEPLLKLADMSTKEQRRTTFVQVTLCADGCNACTP